MAIGTGDNYRSSKLARWLPSVVDGNFQTVVTDAVPGRGNNRVHAKEHSAVAHRRLIKVELEDVVAPFLFGDEHVRTAIVGIQGAVFDGALTGLGITRDPTSK